MHPFPESIADEDQLDDLLSRPTSVVCDQLDAIRGDFIILGAGGKMGPSLTQMLCRACETLGKKCSIYAVSRFTSSSAKRVIEASGATPISGDLLDESLYRSLPDADNVIFMTGMKFGTADGAPQTWAMNTYLPTLVCRRYLGKRTLAFSTGNIYPLVRPESGGSRESDGADPVGEYGMSALGRERMFEYFSLKYGSPTSLVRLNYAVAVRYGVLVDLALQVWNDVPIDLSTGYANVIWQGDANAMALCALADAGSPAVVTNIAGPEIFRIKDVCEQFGQLMNKSVSFVGEEQATALLNNGTGGHQKYEKPQVTLGQLVRWVAHWIQSDGPVLNKPTQFQVRDGNF